MADTRAPCRKGRLRAWLDALLWERGPGAPDVLRTKGVLALAGRPERHVLQAARGPGGSAGRFGTLAWPLLCAGLQPVWVGLTSGLS